MNGFEKYDKPRMNQLPGESYTLCDYKYFLKVPDNYHLEYDAHYYSVLYTYKGKLAILKATMTEIRICDEYNRLICRHPRYPHKPQTALRYAPRCSCDLCGLFCYMINKL